MVAYAIKVLNDPVYRYDGRLNRKRVVWKPDLEAIHNPGRICLDRGYAADALEPIPIWLERQLPKAFDDDATIEAEGFKATAWEAVSKSFAHEIVKQAPPEAEDVAVDEEAPARCAEAGKDRKIVTIYEPTLERRIERLEARRGRGFVDSDAEVSDRDAEVGDSDADESREEVGDSDANESGVI